MSVVVDLGIDWQQCCNVKCLLDKLYLCCAPAPTHIIINRKKNNIKNLHIIIEIILIILIRCWKSPMLQSAYAVYLFAQQRGVLGGDSSGRSMFVDDLRNMPIKKKYFFFFCPHHNNVIPVMGRRKEAKLKLLHIFFFFFSSIVLRNNCS